MATIEALDEFSEPEELSERVQESLRKHRGSLAAVSLDYVILATGLLDARVPGSDALLKSFAQENPDNLPILLRSEIPMLRVYAGHPTEHDHRLMVMTEDTWILLSDHILQSSFVDRGSGLVVWPDFEHVEVPNSVLAAGLTANPVRIFAVILRSNKGAWRYQKSQGGLFEAYFKKDDAGNARMAELAKQLDVGKKT